MSGEERGGGGQLKMGTRVRIWARKKWSNYGGGRVCVEGRGEYVGHKNKKAIHLVLVPFFPGGERIEKNEATRAAFPYVHIFFLRTTFRLPHSRRIKRNR